MITAILFDVMQYSPTIVYKKGKDLHIADTLSRDCLNKAELDKKRELEIHIVLSMSTSAKNDIVSETAKDIELQEVIETTFKGWPENQQDVSNIIKPYWNFREELACYEGILFKGEKIVIPKSQIKKMLEQIHQGHHGIQRSLSRARELLFWNGMSTDIQNYVERCSVCQQRQKSKPKEPLIN